MRNPEVQAAIEIATRYHANQDRKHEIKGVPLPYIAHPIQVMTAVWKWGAGTPTNLKAAVCHDLLEDTKCPRDELLSVIGQPSMTVVEELTFIPPAGTKDAEKSLLKAEYIRSFSRKSVDALLIKMADRICNVLDFYQFDKDYAVRYFHKADEVFSTFYDRFREIQDAHGSACYDTVARSVRNLESHLHGGGITLE